MPNKQSHPSEGAGVCSVCNKPYAYLRQHERNVHKIYVTKAKTAKRPSKALIAVNHKEENPNTIRVLTNFQVVTDGKRIGMVEWMR